jgi:uncharacterized protein YggT (Ycf19 family)
VAVQGTTNQGQLGPVETPTYLRVSNILVRFLYFWTLFGVIVLSLRVLLLAFSANPATEFVTFIYDTSSRYLEPFRGIFPTKETGSGGYLDVSALFAIIMYLLFMWAVVALIEYVERRMREAQAHSVTTTRKTTN